MEHSNLEGLIERFVLENNETSKVDLKKEIDIHSKYGQAELIRDVIAIANAQSDFAEESGYLIIGAKDKQFFDITRLKLDDAEIQQIVNGRVHKPVKFSYKELEIQGKKIGVIVIPRSSERPHIVKTNLNDDKGVALLKEGECYIRQGSSKKKAQREDFDLMYDDRVTAQVAKLVSNALKGERVITVSEIPDLLSLEVGELNEKMPNFISKSNPLIAQVDKLSAKMVGEWRKNKGKTQSETELVKSIIEVHLKQVLTRLVVVGLHAVRFNSSEVLDPVFRAFKLLYELSNDESLGIQGSPDHLSWSVPSKLSMTALYTIGGYATLNRKLETIYSLTKLEVVSRNSELRPLLTHPNYLYSSGEGDLTAFFDAARKLILSTPEVFSLFNQDENVLTNSVCEFDFLVGCSYFSSNQKDKDFRNCTRFYGNRIKLLVDEIKKTPDDYKKLLGNDAVNAYKKFVANLDLIIQGQSGLWTWRERNWN